MQELHSDQPLAKDCIRRARGGRHAVLPQHPEWIQAVVWIIEPHTAGLPLNENVVWVSLNKTQIQNEIAKYRYEISRYHVTQTLDSLELKDRNEQFENIAATRKSLEEVGIPVISVDTKKKNAPAGCVGGCRIPWDSRCCSGRKTGIRSLPADTSVECSTCR